MSRIASRISIVLLALSASVSIASAGLVDRTNTRVIEANVTGTANSADLGQFVYVNQGVDGSGGTGQQENPPWSVEDSHAEQASLFAGTGEITVFDKVHAHVSTDTASAACDARSFFEAGFRLTEETPYTLSLMLSVTRDGGYVVGDGEGEATTTVTLAGSSGGEIFSYTVSVLAESGDSSDFVMLPTTPGTLAADTYTFTVETVCSVSVTSGTGEPFLKTQNNATLTVPEPATVGLLGLGVLAGLRRRRRRK